MEAPQGWHIFKNTIERRHPTQAGFVNIALHRGHKDFIALLLLEMATALHEKKDGGKHLEKFKNWTSV